jgi:hypothetical protein
MSDNASGLNGSAQLHDPASEQCIEVICSPKSTQKCVCRKKSKITVAMSCWGFPRHRAQYPLKGRSAVPVRIELRWQLQGAGVKSAGRGFKACPRIGTMNAEPIRESWDYRLAEPSERLASVSNPSDEAADPVPTPGRISSQAISADLICRCPG